jgi:hypothetical protein
VSPPAWSAKVHQNYQFPWFLIDTSISDGRLAVYGHKHFPQALAVRKLLWKKMRLPEVTEVLRGKEVEDLRRLILDGVDLAAISPPPPAKAPTDRETEEPSTGTPENLQLRDRQDH